MEANHHDDGDDDDYDGGGSDPFSTRSAHIDMAWAEVHGDDGRWTKSYGPGRQNGRNVEQKLGLRDKLDYPTLKPQFLHMAGGA